MAYRGWVYREGKKDELGGVWGSDICYVRTEAIGMYAASAARETYQNLLALVRGHLSQMIKAAVV